MLALHSKCVDGWQRGRVLYVRSSLRQLSMLKMVFSVSCQVMKRTFQFTFTTSTIDLCVYEVKSQTGASRYAIWRWPKNALDSRVSQPGLKQCRGRICGEKA